MITRQFAIAVSLFLLMIVPLLIPVNALMYDETDSGIYVKKQSEFQLILHGGEELSYFVIYFNATDDQEVNWKITVNRGGYFQLYFMEGHKNVDMMILMTGAIFFNYIERYSEDSDVKHASGSYSSREEDGRFTILLLNKKNEDVVLNVDVSVTKDVWGNLITILYCCGALMVFVLIPSAIVTAIKYSLRKNKRDQGTISQTPMDTSREKSGIPGSRYQEQDPTDEFWSQRLR